LDQFPTGVTGGTEYDNYVMEFSGVIDVLGANDYTFDVNSDDGFTLVIYESPTTVYQMEYLFPRGPTDTLSTFFLTAGQKPFRLVFYQAGGGDEVEVSTAAGSFTSWNSGFRLLGDFAGGGFQVHTTPDTPVCAP